MLCTCVLQISGKHIKRLNNEESLKKVAADSGVEVTVGDWIRKQNDTKKWVNQSVSRANGLA